MHKTSHRMIHNVLLLNPILNIESPCIKKIGRLFCAMIMIRSNIGNVPILAKSGNNVISYEM